MVDENAPRDQWKLGRIETIAPEGDRVRKVSVKTASGKSYERHITKLVALEME